MDDSVTWNYDNPVYDQQKGRWYYEGRRPDGSRVRKYPPPVGDNQTTHQETRSTNYQSTPRNDASALVAGVEAMSIQPVGSYDGDAQHYTTVQPGGYSQATSGQGNTWSERRPSVYTTAGATTSTASGTDMQQSGLDVYSQSPGTSNQAHPAETHHYDRQHGNYAAGLSGELGHQQYNEVKRDSVTSYTAPSTSLYGARDGNQMHYSDGYGAQPSAPMDPAYTDTRSSDKPRKHKHSSKGKGKSRADPDPYSGASEGKPMAYNMPPSSSSSAPQGDYHSNYTYYDSAPGQPYRTSSYQGQGDYGGQGGYTPSQTSRYGTSPTSISSSAPRNLPSLSIEATVGSTDGDFEFNTRDMYEQGGVGGGSSTGHRGSAYQMAAGGQVPSKSHPKPTKSDVTSGMQTNAEYLDGRYQVQPSMKFEPGNVFKVMWSEPKGGTIPGGGSRFSDTLLQDHLSGVWTGFRRFIVIRNGEGHCSCVPILTYGKLGCLKNGVKPHHHGIVFENGQQPIRLPNEPSLRFEPIRMEMNPGEHISEESRVNYSKLVTVEHNVKVLFVGNVLYEDWPIVQQAVDECWDSKKSHRSEHPGSGHRSGHRRRR
ncbi:hypothetical protein DHEL01_v202224 [Diaporthe helianthi]|uniref:DUF6590 domain-containing protein n=1 Tax=Diaporthe helianthi TaxID=158607 RepID=A0A2P5IA88_DIAHE|nr:hypothetical protein DHEL01_v202224 [Diaporthe helianthi]